MITYKNLTLIGTSHISIESVREVERVIYEQRPDVVALELDKGRFKVLMSNQKSRISISDIRRVGVKGFIFALIGGYIEKKLGKIVGIMPGGEMKKAAKCAKKVNARIALIDQKIEITLKRFSKKITWKEKLRVIKDVAICVIKRPKVRVDLRKVPDKKLIKKLLGHLKKNYPNVYQVLVEERNKIMAKHLYTIMQRYKVIGVVGAGHEEGIIKEVKCLEEKN